MPPHFAQSRALAGPWSTVEQEDRLVPHRQYREGRHIRIHMPAGDDGAGGVAFAQHSFFGAPAEKVFVLLLSADRKSVVWGKSVSVRVDLGGLGIIKKKTRN